MLHTSHLDNQQNVNNHLGEVTCNIAENIHVTLALNNVLQYIYIVDEVYGIVKVFNYLVVCIVLLFCIVNFRFLESEYTHVDITTIKSKTPSDAVLFLLNTIHVHVY